MFIASNQTGEGVNSLKGRNTLRRNLGIDHLICFLMGMGNGGWGAGGGGGGGMGRQDYDGLGFFFEHFLLCHCFILDIFFSKWTHVK